MIYILIPIFNEEENIKNLYNELVGIDFVESVFYVFSDDGSTDNTNKKIAEFFTDDSYIILGDGKNYGPGNAFNTGFEWILQNSKSDNDIVVTIEADCTSDLNILNEMILLSQLKYDLVLASVYAQGGGFDSTNFFRKTISFIANLTFRTIFDIKVQTISSFYRVYRINILRKIKTTEKNIIIERGFICMLEVLIKAIRLNAKIIEVPMVLHSSKRQGKSKMKIMKTTKEYLVFFFKLNRKKK